MEHMTSKEAKLPQQTAHMLINLQATYDQLNVSKARTISQRHSIFLAGFKTSLHPAPIQPSAKPVVRLEAAQSVRSSPLVPSQQTP
jgi:hypothetical protein